jgi:hypothetical protein
MEVARADQAHAAESLIIALSTTPSYVTLLPEGDISTGNVSLVAYVTDRFQGRTRVTTVVGVGTLADSFKVSAGGRRLAQEPDAFAVFVLYLTSSLLGGAALVGDSEGAVGNVANLASVANSPSGAAGMSADKTQELVSQEAAIVTRPPLPLTPPSLEKVLRDLFLGALLSRCSFVTRWATS